jgi:hypothetical protein
LKKRSKKLLSIAQPPEFTKGSSVWPETDKSFWFFAVWSGWQRLGWSRRRRWETPSCGWRHRPVASVTLDAAAIKDAARRYAVAYGHP